MEKNPERLSSMKMGDVTDWVRKSARVDKK